MKEQFVAEYLRLSMEDGDVVSDSDKEESDSIQYQRELISRYLHEENLYPDIQTLEFVDDGYSGTNFERPAVKRMLSMVREGKICCIIVKDISPFLAGTIWKWEIIWNRYCLLWVSGLLRLEMDMTAKTMRELPEGLRLRSGAFFMICTARIYL